MNPFFVLAPGDFLDHRNARLAIEAFARVYRTLTPKHQRRMRLIIIDEDENHSKHLHLARKLKAEGALQVVSRFDAEQAERAYQQASVFFCATDQSLASIIPEALSYGLPILSTANAQIKDYIDNTCGMIVEKRSESQLIEGFSRMFSMLYFDPEVRKILQKGAKRKYRNHFCWGVYERRLRAGA